MKQTTKLITAPKINLPNFNHPAVITTGVLTSLLIVYLVYILVQNLFVKIKYKAKELPARGYIEKKYSRQNGTTTEGFKFFWMRNYDNRFEIYPTSAQKTQSEINDDLQWFNETLNVPIVELKKVSFRYWLSPLTLSTKIIAFKQKFPDQIHFKKTCPSLNKLEVYLGVDGQGRKVVLNQKEHCFGAILGTMGSGKTIALEAVIESHRVTDSRTKFIIASTKPYQDFGYYQALPEFELFNTSDNGELEKLLKRCEQVAAEISRRSQVVADAGAKHATDVPALEPIILILDEANLYLNKSSAKVTEERLALVTQLVRVMDQIIRQSRFAAVNIWIGSQGDTIKEVDIDIKLAHFLVVSRTNIQQSRNLFGSEISFDFSLTKGKFVIRGPESIPKIIKTPFPVN